MGTGAYTWAVAHLELLRAQGWVPVLLAAIFFACLTAIAVSQIVLCVAYFRAGKRSHANVTTAEDNSVALELIGRAESEFREKYIELSKYIDRLNDQITLLNGKMASSEPRVHTTIAVLIEILNLIILEKIISPPKLSDNMKIIVQEKMVEETELMKTYISNVISDLSGTSWHYDLQSILSNCELESDHYVNNMPETERPENVDPLKFRLYFIYKMKTKRTKNFIEKERLETDSKIKHYLSRMREYKRIGV